MQLAHTLRNSNWSKGCLHTSHLMLSDKRLWLASQRERRKSESSKLFSQWYQPFRAREQARAQSKIQMWANSADVLFPEEKNFSSRSRSVYSTFNAKRYYGLDFFALKAFLNFFFAEAKKVTIFLTPSRNRIRSLLLFVFFLVWRKFRLLLLNDVLLFPFLTWTTVFKRFPSSIVSSFIKINISNVFQSKTHSV